MKCFQCNNNAEHQHHVVPKSKGGTKTIPLCVECHSKVHNKSMAGIYLTKLGLMRSMKPYHAFIFWEYVIKKTTIKEIANECEKSDQWVKNQIKRMKAIYPNDLMDILYPEIAPNGSKFYTREYLTEQWNHDT
jgi:hypothetical protein